MSRVMGADINDGIISSRYSHAALVMSHRIEQNLEIGQVEFPKGVLEEAVHAFDMAVGAIGTSGDSEKDQYYLFFCKELSIFSRGKYEGDSADEKLVAFSGLMKNLKEHGGNIVRVARQPYIELQSFFEHLHERMAEINFESYHRRMEDDSDE